MRLPYLRRRTANAAIRIPNRGTQQPQNRNDDQGNERKNNCILNKTLTVFPGREEHGVVPFWRDLDGYSVTLLISFQDRIWGNKLRVVKQEFQTNSDKSKRLSCERLFCRGERTCALPGRDHPPINQKTPFLESLFCRGERI